MLGAGSVWSLRMQLSKSSSAVLQIIAHAGINGITSLSTSMGAIRIRRQDFVITNKRDERLQCSYWEPDDPIVTSKPIPAVVYCHCNSGSRLDAAEAISILLPMGVRVFSMDFSVCHIPQHSLGCKSPAVIPIHLHTTDDPFTLAAASTPSPFRATPLWSNHCIITHPPDNQPQPKQFLADHLPAKHSTMPVLCHLRKRTIATTSAKHAGVTGHHSPCCPHPRTNP